MNHRCASDWITCNQNHLTDQLQRLRVILESYADAPGISEASKTESLEWPIELPPPAIDHLVRLFQLSPFERDILLLCAGVEFDARFLPLLKACHSDPTKAYPTFGLALAVLPDAHWSALTPDAPLRRWKMISLSHGALTTSPIQIDEQILHYLAGTPYVHERLAPLLEPIGYPHHLASPHAAVAFAARALWQMTEGPLPLIQLVGPHSKDRRSVAVRVCADMGYDVAVITANMLPTHYSEVEELARLCVRESVLRRLVVLIESDSIETIEVAKMASVSRFIDRVHGPILLSDREPRFSGSRSVRTFDIETLSTAEQSAEWRSGFDDRIDSLNGSIDRIVSQFRLSAATIREIASDTTLAPERLWDECRIRSRVKLDGLARRIEPTASWADLIVPPAQEAALRELTAHVRHRTTVYENWGFAHRTKRGLGITALFAGASGTGKTTAAEVLAGELGLDLYCIDLSSVMSKYIGETEANLRRVFDAAEQSGAVLQFDEADALFGKRAEVKDSHDRYANIEVSYLLQRMEEYRGLAILTTNRKSALDTAFLRRIRFVVQFPFPDETERERIWRRMFPPAAPIEELDFATLARLPLSGGNIRSITLGAAFLAADAGEPVRMRHVLSATRTEYGKLERPFAELDNFL